MSSSPPQPPNEQQATTPTNELSSGSDLSPSSTASSQVLPILAPPVSNPHDYDDMLIRGMDDMIRAYLTRQYPDHVYHGEFRWLIDLRHNLSYNVIVTINRTVNHEDD